MKSKILILMLVVCSIFIGAGVTTLAQKPEIITLTETEFVNIPVVEFIEIPGPVSERVVEVVKEVPVIVKEPVLQVEIVEVEKEVLPDWWSDYARLDYVPFKSDAEIKEYIKTIDLYTGLGGEVDFDCDDIVFNVYRQAIIDRRPLGLVLVTDRSVCGHMATGVVTEEFFESLDINGIFAVKGKNSIKWAGIVTD